MLFLLSDRGLSHHRFFGPPHQNKTFWDQNQKAKGPQNGGLSSSYKKLNFISPLDCQLAGPTYGIFQRNLGDSRLRFTALLRRYPITLPTTYLITPLSCGSIVWVALWCLSSLPITTPWKSGCMARNIPGCKTHLRGLIWDALLASAHLPWSSAFFLMVMGLCFQWVIVCSKTQLFQ